MHFKNPTFGNTYSQENNVLIRRLPSGEAKVFSDPYWPKVESFHIAFRGLESNRREELLNFFTSIAGNEIILIDHENVSWRGFVVNDPIVRRERDNCMYAFELDFEGVKA